MFDLIICWGTFPESERYHFKYWTEARPGHVCRRFGGTEEAYAFLRYLAHNYHNIRQMRHVLGGLGHGVMWDLRRMDDEAVLRTLAQQLCKERVVVIDERLGRYHDNVLANYLAACNLLPDQCGPEVTARRIGELRAAPEPGLADNLRAIYNNRDLPRVEKIRRGMQVLLAPAYYQAQREQAPTNAADIARGAAKALGNAGLDLGELLIEGVINGAWPFGDRPLQISLARFEIEAGELRGAGLMQAATKVAAMAAFRSAAQQAGKASRKPAATHVEKETDLHAFTGKPRAGVPNPHAGHHNQTWDNVKSDGFETARPVDIRNLSPQDLEMQALLTKQGWDDKRKQREILSSGSGFKTKSLQPGDRLYGFNSAGRGPKGKEGAAYWLDEAGFNDLKAKHHKDGHWDRQGVKEYLALPCKNRADALDMVEVTAPQVAIESRIGAATERLRYIRDDQEIEVSKNVMKGGGLQITPDKNKLGEVKQLW